MSDRAQFLRARFDEDEAVARAADRKLGAVRRLIDRENRHIRADETHILRHDPARVRREVKAKREILHAWEIEDNRDMRHALGYVVSLITAVHSDHPDYDPAWGPAQEEKTSVT